MFESKNKYFGRKKGKSFSRLEHLQDKLIEPSASIFKNIKLPRVLEIGIGDGEKISEDAKNNLKTNFIGCDIFADGVLRAIRNSIDNKLNNLLVFYLNIQDILPFIPNDYLNGIRIFFPDPWPKNRHKKRRTFNESLVEDLSKKLKKNGFIHFATDHSDYFLEALILMKQFNYIIKDIGPDSWKYNESNALNTKFEKKALDKNHKLFYFSVLKNY
ncbi:tRNA (guanosine(46)-N7)-methyltransferase TrmB [Alphaproteobacteria bacterium]|nr:tRNA (guanosine(46)-N7)-methyltransferase TrmB [Alphaproteobacteria bacterium]